MNFLGSERPIKHAHLIQPTFPVVRPVTPSAKQEQRILSLVERLRGHLQIESSIDMNLELISTPHQRDVMPGPAGQHGLPNRQIDL